MRQTGPFVRFSRSIFLFPSELLNCQRISHTKDTFFLPSFPFLQINIGWNIYRRRGFFVGSSERNSEHEPALRYAWNFDEYFRHFADTRTDWKLRERINFKVSATKWCVIPRIAIREKVSFGCSEHRSTMKGQYSSKSLETTVSSLWTGFSPKLTNESTWNLKIKIFWHFLHNPGESFPWVL